MTIIIPVPSLLAGFIAGLLYYLLHNGLIYGVTAPFLPVFFLALSGMSYGRAGMTASLIPAIPVVLAMLPLHDALLVIGGQLIPLAVFIRVVMTASWTADPPALHWSSPSLAISALSLYGAAFYGCMIGSDSGLYHSVSTEMLGDIRRGFSSLDPTVAASMETLIQHIPHLLLALDFWAWSLIVFVVAGFANGVAWSLGHGKRAHLRLRAHTPPNGMLAALGLSALLGAAGSVSLMRAGQAASIILLIPYFFSGLGYIHTKLRGFQNAKAWMVGFYVLFFFFNLWPLLCVTLLGLARHVGQYTLFASPSRK